MSGTDPRQAVAALRQRFLSRLPDRLRAMRAALDEARSGAAEGTRELHRLAHSLAGTAATFRVEDVARIARQMEDALDQGPPDDAALAQQAAWIDALAGLAGDDPRAE